MAETAEAVSHSAHALTQLASLLPSNGMLFGRSACHTAQQAAAIRSAGHRSKAWQASTAEPTQQVQKLCVPRTSCIIRPACSYPSQCCWCSAVLMMTTPVHVTAQQQCSCLHPFPGRILKGKPLEVECACQRLRHAQCVSQHAGSQKCTLCIHWCDLTSTGIPFICQVSRYMLF